MTKVYVEIYQNTHSEYDFDIPQDVIDKGDTAIRDWLYMSGAVDHALDHGTSDTELNYQIEE